MATEAKLSKEEIMRIPAENLARRPSAHETRSSGRLHHVGFVVPSINGAIERFESGLQLRWDQHIFYDPVQTVRVTFLRRDSGDEPLIELVEPASPTSRVAGFLSRGGGLHHLCYEIDSLDDGLQTALSAGGILVLPASPAIAFSGREIAWVCTADRLLVEYLQREPRDADDPAEKPDRRASS